MQCFRPRITILINFDQLALSALFQQVCRVFKDSGQSYNLGDEGPKLKFDHVKERYRLSYVGPEEFVIGEL